MVSFVKTTKALTGLLLSVIAAMLLLSSQAAASNVQDDVEFTADYAVNLGNYVRSEQFHNNIMYIPADLRDILGSGGSGDVAFNTKVSRTFVTLSSYFINTQNQTVHTNIEDWMAQYATVGPLVNRLHDTFTDRQMLTVTGFPDFLTNHTTQQFNFTLFESYLEDYLHFLKSNIPSIEFVECGNEYNVSSFYPYATTTFASMGPTEPRIATAVAEYIQLYKACSNAVKAVNDTLTPLVPLKVGGPVLNDLYRDNQLQPGYAAYMEKFLLELTNPANNVQVMPHFISWHHYDRNPIRLQDSVDFIREKLDDAGLNVNTPLVVSEFGFDPANYRAKAATPNDISPTYEDLAIQAAFSTDAAFQMSIAGVSMPINWLVTHNNMLFKSMYHYNGINSGTSADWQTISLDAPVTDQYVYFRYHKYSNQPDDLADQVYDDYIRLREIQFISVDPITQAETIVPVLNSPNIWGKESFDGDINTVWEGRFANITYDLGVSHLPIHKVKLLWAPIPIVKEAEAGATSGVLNNASSSGGAYWRPDFDMQDPDSTLTYTFTVDRKDEYNLKINYQRSFERVDANVFVNCNPNVNACSGHRLRAFQTTGSSWVIDNVGDFVFEPGKTYTLYFKKVVPAGMTQNYHRIAIDYISLGGKNNTCTCSVPTSDLNGSYDFMMMTSDDLTDWTDPLDLWRKTPLFYSMQMRSMLGDDRVSAAASVAKTWHGYGPEILATENSDSKLSILVWNYQIDEYGNSLRSSPLPVTDYNATLDVDNLPAGFANKNIKYTRYVTGKDQHNYVNDIGCTQAPYDCDQQFDPVVDGHVYDGEDPLSLTFSLPANSVSLIILEATEDDPKTECTN